MSRNTSVPVGATLERFATSERTALDDGTPAVVVVAVWEGNYSQGYKSDYDRIATRWLTVEARHADTGRLLYWSRYEPRRTCQQYSGKRYAKAIRDFETICKQDRYPEGTAADAHRYYHQRLVRA